MQRSSARELQLCPRAVEWQSERTLVFEWDETNIRRLGRKRITPDEVEQCYSTDPLVWKELLTDGQTRFLALGESDAGRRLAFVFMLPRGQVRLRLITAYPMTRAQQEIYERG
ncbi:MAG TPA: hypothetical protein VH437_03000 [Terriglobales bacterium]|jgi:uncharacterized DUF497 family protein